ncbi:TatD family hydrolase [Portibacter marinus]|uniref:TatD family hydrolase n=1 Tax=Portibacter marinus TaxID=2898660 RepID=UPI001F37EF6A|nr:TatD family hydrolase [Portibacter marinus]
MFIDTHAHLYLDQFSDDIDMVVELCKEEGVEHIYLPNVDAATVDSLHELVESYPSMMHPMMGVHPCSINENYRKELELALRLLEQREYAGIGEIGIDLYWDKTFHKEQQEAFRIQIEWARDMNKPFVIHSRDSLDETIDIVSHLQDGTLTGIFHCFNGNEEQARKIIDIGFLLGIGGVITFKNAGVREELVNISINHMVLETDAPYLSPTPFRGKRNQSNYIPIIAEQLAETLEIEVEQVEKITTQNAINLFNTPIQL